MADRKLTTGGRRPPTKRQQPTRRSGKAARPEPAATTYQELPDDLRLRLTREALGEDGSPEAFVMLLLGVEEALKAGETVAAQNLLFRSVAHAFDNSGHHVDALMSFRDTMKLRLAALRHAGAGNGERGQS